MYIYELYSEETNEYYIGRTKREIMDRFYEHRTKKTDSIYKWMHSHKITIKELFYQENISDYELAELELRYSLIYYFAGKALINKSFGNYKRTVIEKLVKKGMNIEEIINYLHHEYIKKEKVYKLYKVTYEGKILITSLTQSFKIMKFLLKKYGIDLNNASLICLCTSKDKKLIHKLRKIYIKKFMKTNIMFNKKIGDNYTDEEIERRRDTNIRNKKVQCSVNGKIYRSMNEAAREVGTTHISDCILGKRKTAGKINGIPCEWRLVE